MGMSDRIVKDHITAFTSKDFEKYYKSNNIKHILNAVRTPRANGHAERTNRIILSSISVGMTISDQSNQYHGK